MLAKKILILSVMAFEFEAVPMTGAPNAARTRGLIRPWTISYPTPSQSREMMDMAGRYYMSCHSK